MLRLVVLAEAQDELLQTALRYETEQQGLGHRFWNEVDRCIGWIHSHHDTPRLRPGGYRRVDLRTFPYYLPYIERGSSIWILAVAHARRRPGYWLDR